MRSLADRRFGGLYGIRELPSVSVRFEKLGIIRGDESGHPNN